MTRETPDDAAKPKITHPRCPFCHAAVAPSQPKAACMECMAWHHDECWSNHGGCSACGLRELTEPTLALDLPQPSKATAAPAQDPHDPRIGSVIESAVGSIEILEHHVLGPMGHTGHEGSATGLSDSARARAFGRRSYMGRELKTNAPCVVTFYEAFSPRAQARIQRESQILCQLPAHPNLLQVRSVSDDGTFVRVDAWDAGCTLDALGRVQPDVATRIVQGVAAALGVLHENFMIHRRLNPGVVLVNPAGKPRLRLPDWTDSEDETALLTGLSLPYLAPEIGRSRQLDGRIDIYCLGLIYYRLLTGHHAFEAFSAIEILKMDAHRGIPPPERYVPDLPTALRRVLGKMLEVDRDRRYPDIPALERDLSALRNPQVEAGSPSLWGDGTEASPPPKRKRFWARLFG